MTTRPLTMPRLTPARLAMSRLLPLVAAALVAALLPGPAPAQPRGKAEPIIILNNKGGNVLEAVQYRNRLAASARPVQVRGYCRSACTIYTTLPNACLGPNATIGFHAPRIPGTTIIPPLVDEIMGRFYRGGILRKWNSEWKHSLKMHKISARDYVRLDPQTKLCPR
ncbi:hypothetical protein [Paracoccus yeei]|nr:hypothetical protein [Paracoccus yeei]